MVDSATQKIRSRKVVRSPVFQSKSHRDMQKKRAQGQLSNIYIYIYLVGGLEHFLFSIIYGIILPIDFHIFQRGRYTTNQIYISGIQPGLTDKLRGPLPRRVSCEDIWHRALRTQYFSGTFCQHLWPSRFYMSIHGDFFVSGKTTKHDVSHPSALHGSS